MLSSLSLLLSSHTDSEVVIITGARMDICMTGGLMTRWGWFTRFEWVGESCGIIMEKEGED